MPCVRLPGSAPQAQLATLRGLLTNPAASALPQVQSRQDPRVLGGPLPRESSGCVPDTPVQRCQPHTRTAADLCRATPRTGFQPRIGDQSGYHRSRCGPTAEGTWGQVRASTPGNGALTQGLGTSSRTSRAGTQEINVREHPRPHISAPERLGYQPCPSPSDER